MTPLAKFLQAAASLAKQGVKRDEILKFAKLQFGKVTDEITKAVDDIFEKSPLQKILEKRKAAKQSVDERKVLDMEGNVIDPNQPIIGGTQIKRDYGDALLEQKAENFLKRNVKKEQEELDQISEIEELSRDLSNESNVDKILSKSKELKKSKADKGIATLKTKFTPEQAADDIFPSGDYKYDMDMAAESYVENNPEMFKNMLYEDLDQATQMKVYEKVSKVIGRRNAEKIKARRSSPEQTPKGFQLNVEKFVQDFPVSKEEAVRISKLPTDEQQKIIQTYLDEDFSRQITLMDFDVTKRKPNSKGGRVKMAKGGLPNILGF